MHRGVYGGSQAPVRSALVGRAAELDHLAALHRRVTDGGGCVAVLWGGAGVGKTRLLHEFAARAGERGATVAGATSFEYLAAPFGPFLGIFQALGLPDVFPKGGEPGRSRASVEAGKYKAFAAAAEALRARSRVDPLVLWIDDAQWADLASLELLSFFTRGLAGIRTLIVAAVRSDDLDRDPTRFEMFARLRRPELTVDLHPLREGEMRQLVASLWPAEHSLDSGELTRLCALAEGRPYFAEELVRSALEHRESNAAEMPLSIRAGVLARFARLTPERQRVLSYAAVLGVRFDGQFLADLMDRPLAKIWSALEAGCDVQILRETRERAGEYVFRHALTREVLYLELLTTQARAIHASIAERFEAQSEPADPAQVAYHWASARESERAAAAFARAGDLAVARSAYADAAAAFRSAVAELGEGDPRYANLCERLYRALAITGDVDESTSWGERAVAAYMDAGETAQAASLALRLGRRAYEAGRPEKAIEVVKWAQNVLGTSGNDALRFDAYVSQASFDALQGRSASAAEQLDKAAAIGGDVPPEYRHHFHLVRAMVRATRKQLRAAFEDYGAALDLARQLGDDERLIWTLNNYGSRGAVAGRTDIAISAFTEALELAERRNLAKVANLVRQGLALAQLLSGDIAAASRTHDKGSEVNVGHALAQTTATSVGLRLAYLRGDDAAAERYASSQALDLAFRSGEPQNIGLLAECVAAFYSATGRDPEAWRLRRRALEHVHYVDFSLWLLDRMAMSTETEDIVRARTLLDDAAQDPDHAAALAHLALFDARVALNAGKRDEGRALARSAADRFATIGWPWEEAQAREASGEAARAQALYEKHGYTRDAERVVRQRRRARHRPSAQRLTPREMEVVQLVIAGKSNRAIAQELFIGERTVETHIAAIFDRFDLKSRSQLIRFRDGSDGSEQRPGESSTLTNRA